MLRGRVYRMKQRIGIYSGTFDPVHKGHIEFALEAIAQASLDRVYFMVEQRPRRKQGVKAFEHRQAMVQLAIADEPMLGSIITEQKQFTAESTLPVLKSRFGSAELYLLMGDDMLSHLADWPHVDELLKSVNFLIGVRHDQIKAVERIKTVEKTRGLQFNYSLFDSPNKTLSSSRVRRQLRSLKTPTELPVGVYDYILEENLYSPDDPSAN